MKTLGDVKVGESSTIVKLHGEGALRRHLMDLGLIKGTSFKVVKVAPLGDPVEINVRGYELSIRIIQGSFHLEFPSARRRRPSSRSSRGLRRIFLQIKLGFSNLMQHFEAHYPARAEKAARAHKEEGLNGGFSDPCRTGG